MGDITETGPVGLKGLKGLKGLSQRNSKEAEVDKFIAQQEREKEVDDFIAAQKKLDTPEKVASAFKADAVSNYGNALMEMNYGSSMYDKDATEANLSDLNEFRAQRQPWYSQLASGIGKGIVQAGTTFLDGIVGLMYGTAKGVSEAANSDSFVEGTKNFFSSLFDNEISNSIGEINEAMEEVLPNYRTNEEINNNWWDWENLSSMNLWANEFLKNIIGFTTGAAYSGKAWLSALKSLNLVKGTMGAKAIGSVLSAVNEGRVEANNAMNDSFDLAKMQIEDASNKRRNEILNSNLSYEDKALLLEDLNNNTQGLLEDAKNRADSTGLAVLLGNTVLLSLDNFWTFGKLYAKGFSEAKNLAKGAGKRVTLSDVSKAAGKELEKEASEIPERVAKEGVKYNWNDITKKEAIQRGLITGLTEGNEELAQQAIANTYSNMYSPDSPDAYYKAMIDSKANVKTRDFLDSAIQGLADSYGDGSQWEQFAVGFLTGLVGIPTFGKVSNSDASTYAGRGKMIGLSGGLFGELSTAKDINRRGRQSVDEMNKFVETLQNGKRRFARSTAFTDAMDGFAADGNRNEYQNYADNDFFSAISSFMSTGREQDLMDMVDQDFENMSDKELTTIASSFSKNPDIQDSKEGGWRNTDGTLSPLTDEGREKMRKELIDKRDKIKDQIKSYKDSLLKVRAISNNSLKKDEEEELAWYDWKSKRAADRIGEIKKKNKEGYSSLYEQLSNFRNHIKTLLESDSVIPRNLVEALEYNMNKNRIEDSKKNLTGVLNYVDSVLSVLKSIQESGTSNLEANLLGGLFSENREFIEDLKNNKKLYDLVIGPSMTYDEYKGLIGDLQDIIKLHDARKTFVDRFNEFTENPTKLQKNREKLEKEQEKVDKEVDKMKSRNDANKVTRAQVIKGEVDSKAAKDSLTESDADKAAKILIEDAEKSKELADKVTTIINRAQVDASDSESQVLEEAAEAVEVALAKSESYSELTDPSSSIYMYDKNGNPISDEAIAIAQKAITKALNEMEESEGFDEETIKDAEEQISKQEEASTGHDATDKINAVNEAVNRQKKEDADKEEEVNKAVKRSSRPNRGSSKKGKTTERKITNLGSKVEKSKRDKSTNTKKSNNTAKSPINTSELAKIVDSYVSGTIEAVKNSNPNNSNLLNLVSSKNFRDSIYALADLINTEVPKMEIDYIKDLLTVLQVSDEYKKVSDLIGEDPTNYLIIDLLNQLKSIDNLKNKIDNILKKESLDKEERPDTIASSTENANTSDYTPERENIVSPFRRATSEVAFGTLKGNKPYYTLLPEGELKEKLRTLYNFLKDNGVFTRQANVKRGATIYFTTNQELNDKIGEVVILMSTDPKGENIVGDLYRKGDRAFQNNEYLKDFYTRFVSSLDEWKKNNTEGNFVFDETSTVNQTMYGSPLFTDSDNKGTDKTLNEIFKGNSSDSVLPFKLGILIDGTIKTSNQGARDETTEEEDRIVKPKKDFSNGTPFVLIPTGNGTNRLIAVPFHMSKYNESMANTKLSQLVQDRVKKILSKYRDNLEDYQSVDILLKSALEDLFVDDFHVNYNKETGVLDVHIGSQKDNNYVSLYRNTIDSNSPRLINSNLLNNNLEIRVNRRLINSNVNINGTSVKYNEIIGELAHNNLDRINTVGDYFTVYPLDSEGNIVRVGTERIKDGRFKSTIPTVRSSVEYKGKTYNITTDNKITDSDNKEVNLNNTEKNIVLAKSTVTDSPNYVNANNSYWHLLPDGNLFYNKDGEERIVSDPKEIQEIKDNLNKPVNEESTTNTKKETPSQEEVKPEYPKYIKTKLLKEAFDMLDKEYKNKLLTASPAIGNRLKAKIDSVLKSKSNKIDQVTKEELNRAIDEVLGIKYRLSNNEEYSPIDVDKESKWLNKVLPNISEEDSLRIVKGLIKVSNSKNPEVAWGQIQDGIITISDIAASGTLYHEAFHYVVDSFLDTNELDTMYNEGSKKYGITREDRYSDLEIEENLAEDFRKYVQSEESLVKGTLTKIYRSLKHIVQSITGNESYINNLFYRINRGKFKNRTISNTRTGSKNRLEEYSDEMKNILDNSPKDSEGRLLAPNGKPSNLTERQYAQVRTKAFKDWFGDWENNPNEASKVIDENGEPLVVYHGTDEYFTLFDINFFGTRDPGDIGKGFYFSPKKYDVYMYGDRVMSVFLNIKNPVPKELYNNIQYFNRDLPKEIKKKDTIINEIDNIKFAIEGYKENLNDTDSNDDFHIEIFTKRIEHYTNKLESLKSLLSSLSKEELETDINKERRDKILLYEKYDGIIPIGAEGNTIKELHEIVVKNSNQIKSATDNIGTFSYDNSDIRYRIASTEYHNYRASKVDYNNLSNSQSNLLKEVGISEDEYNLLTTGEKENLLKCVY